MRILSSSSQTSISSASSSMSASSMSPSSMSTPSRTASTRSTSSVATMADVFRMPVRSFVEESVVRTTANPERPSSSVAPATVVKPVERSARGVENFLKTANADVSDFNTTTFGRVGFRRVEPIDSAKDARSARAEEFAVADARLQQRLEQLCDHLRARY